MPLLLLLCLLTVPAYGWAADDQRIKDVASWRGARDNQLIGYGLVVGLAGTGDKRQTGFAYQSLTNLLTRMGIAVSPAAIQVKNTAAVLLTSTLPAFAQPGMKLDVSVAAIGDASNLQGGIVVMSPLKGADGQVYAVAQGPVITGGFVAGRGGNSQTRNHPTTGRIPAGALTERAAPSVAPSQSVQLQLNQPDLATAARVAAVINRRWPGQEMIARAAHSGLVEIAVPKEMAAQPVDFLAELEQLTVRVDRPARVVVNERTGTIISGKEIRISPVTILHGGLTVEIRSTPVVSQPTPLSNGDTVTGVQREIKAKEDKPQGVVLEQGATVEDLVKALTVGGATARDVISVLQSLRANGALQAEIEAI